MRENSVLNLTGAIFKNVHLEDHSDEMSLIAIQGPKSRNILQRIVSSDLSDIAFYHFIEYDRIAGDDGVVDHDEYMAAGDGGPPTNHWDGNCGAMKHGESEYWLDSDGDPDNGAEDGPYAVWYEDADGNSVDCQPPPNDGNQN